MPAILVGGTRGLGKTEVLARLKARFPFIDHLEISAEVKRIIPKDAFQDRRKGMRRLTPELQCEGIANVIHRTHRIAHDRDQKLIFLDGHFVSSSYVDGHASFFSCIGENALLLDVMILVKAEPSEIITRRVVLGKTIRPFDVTRREYLAEGIEARSLERNYGTELLVCHRDLLLDVILDRFREQFRAADTRLDETG